MRDTELNKKLLYYAGFEGQDVDEFLPKWLEAADALHLTEEQIRHAVDEYIPQCWDIQYRGVRKLIGALIHELVDITQTHKLKAEGKPILYGILPTIMAPYNAIKKAAGPDSYVGFPDALLVMCLNSVFDAAGPIMTLAEENGFTYGCRHCPLNKVRYAGYLSKIFAAPDIIWSYGLICDEGPHTDQMIQGLLGEEWEYVVTRLMHDQKWGNKEDENEERIEYLASILKRDMDRICDKIGVHPGPEHYAAAVEESNRVMWKSAMLNGMVASADPAPLRAFEGGIAQIGFGVVCNNGLKYFEEAIDILTEEVKEAIEKGVGVAPKGATRVGSYYTPMNLPWVDKMFLDNGVITVMSEMSAPTERLMRAPRYEDPYKAFAEIWLKGSTGVNFGYEIEDQAEKVLNSKVDGMYMGFFDFDRWLGAHQKMMAELVEKKTGVPHFYIEADFWDDRDYGEESLRTRIESICEVIKMKKAQREATEAEKGA